MSVGGAVFYFSLLAFSMPCALANEGVIDKIKAGLQSAKSYLETARNIADLVSKSLKSKEGQKKQRGDEAHFDNGQNEKPYVQTNIISSFFRLIGLDSKKITAVAVNSFIFFARLIGEFFNVTPKVESAKSMKDDDAFAGSIRLITENQSEKVKSLLEQAQDETLPEQLMMYVDEKETPCVKLFLCKTSPIIWAAQKALKNKSLIAKRDITSWLPSIEEFEDYSDACDDKHTHCIVNYQST